MVSSERARQLAIALPEAVEQDHHGRPSFRVDGRIFATQWDDEHMNVMLAEGGIRTVHDDPETFSEVWWGKRLAAVQVDLRRVGAKKLGSCSKRRGSGERRSACAGSDQAIVGRAWANVQRCPSRSSAL